MQAKNSPTKLAKSPPTVPEAGPPVPRVYDCTGCRYVDSHGLVCDVCLRKILDGQAERKAFLLAACFEGHGCITLLRGRRAAYV